MEWLAAALEKLADSDKLDKLVGVLETAATEPSLKSGHSHKEESVISTSSSRQSIIINVD